MLHWFLLRRYLRKCGLVNGHRKDAYILHEEARGLAIDKLSGI